MTPSEVAIIETDLDGTVVHWNAGAERLFGFPAREAIGRNIKFLRPPGCGDRVYGLPAPAEVGGVVQSVCTAKDGRLLDVTVSHTPCVDHALSLTGVSCVVRQRSATAEDLLLEVAQRFREGFGFAALGFGVLTLAGRWLAATDSLCTMLGTTQDKLKNAPFQETFPDATDEDRAAIARFLYAIDRPVQATLPIRRKGGVAGKVLVERSLVRDPKGNPQGMLLVMRISDETTQEDQGKRVEDLTRSLAASEKTRRKLESVSTHDPGTGVLARRGLNEALAMEQSRARRYGMSLLAMLVSCDDLKAMASPLLEATQEPLLQAIAHRLTNLLRPGDHLGYVGDHEFLVLLPDTRLAEGSLVADRLRASATQARKSASGSGGAPALSLGVVAIPRESQSIADIVTLAQIALRRAKALAPTTNGPTGAELQRLAATFREGKCFRAVSQGIYRLSDEKRVGFELFSRGPEGPFAMPNEFFHLASQLDLLTIVDAHCLRACVAAGGLLDPHARIHVNVMPRTLAEMPADELVSIFARLGPDRFVVEVSEQQLVGDLHAHRTAFAALKQSGIRVGIDDVGVGRGSLEALILLEPNVVKLDRQFIHGISTVRDMERLLGRLVEVVRSLGAETIAEGIETRADLEVVKLLSITHAQGFFWGPPA
ncbi:MAG: EAL domain-containing protein [Acidobacteriota bacterium]